MSPRPATLSLPQDVPSHKHRKGRAGLAVLSTSPGSQPVPPPSPHGAGSCPFGPRYLDPSQTGDEGSTSLPRPRRAGVPDIAALWPSPPWAAPEETPPPREGSSQPDVGGHRDMTVWLAEEGAEGRPGTKSPQPGSGRVHHCGLVAVPRLEPAHTSAGAGVCHRLPGVCMQSRGTLRPRTGWQLPQDVPIPAGDGSMGCWLSPAPCSAPLPVSCQQTSCNLGLKISEGEGDELVARPERGWGQVGGHGWGSQPSRGGPCKPRRGFARAAWTCSGFCSLLLSPPSPSSHMSGTSGVSPSPCHPCGSPALCPPCPTGFSGGRWGLSSCPGL